MSDSINNKHTEKTTEVELVFNLGINRGEGLASLNLGLEVERALLVERLGKLGLAGLLATKGDRVVVLIPATEGGSINQNDGSLNQCLGSYKFVVGSVVND